MREARILEVLERDASPGGELPQGALARLARRIGVTRQHVSNVAREAGLSTRRGRPPKAGRPSRASA